MHKFLFYNKFIICLYMFRALLCSSSGGQNCIIQHLVSSHSVGGCSVHRLLFHANNGYTIVGTEKQKKNKFCVYCEATHHCGQ